MNAELKKWLDEHEYQPDHFLGTVVRLKDLRELFSGKVLVPVEIDRRSEWATFSFDEFPPTDTPLLVRLCEMPGVYAAMVHTTSLPEDFDYWMSLVAHENADLTSPHVYEAAIQYTISEWKLLAASQEPKQ
jgi:hypothetical protein